MVVLAHGGAGLEPLRLGRRGLAHRRDLHQIHQVHCTGRPPESSRPARFGWCLNLKSFIVLALISVIEVSAIQCIEPSAVEAYVCRVPCAELCRMANHKNVIVGDSSERHNIGFTSLYGDLLITG